jgi:hypothetical protein
MSPAAAVDTQTAAAAATLLLLLLQTPTMPRSLLS